MADEKDKKEVWDGEVREVQCNKMMSKWIVNEEDEVQGKLCDLHTKIVEMIESKTCTPEMKLFLKPMENALWRMILTLDQYKLNRTLH